nr:hypothetical protein [Tanacetum cinerariifolium]
AGGNFLDKMPRECLKIIESKSKVRQSRAKAVVAKVGTSSSTLVISSNVAELKDMVRALLLDKKNQSPAPTPSTTSAPVKAVEANCVTCGGAHSYQNCPATQENAYRDNIQEYVSQAAAVNYNQGNTGFRPQMVANQIRPPGFPPHQKIKTILIKTEEEISTSQISTHLLSIKANLIDLSQGQSTQNQCQNIQNQYQNLQNQMATLTEMMSKLVSANTTSSSGSGTLPVQNPSSQNTAPVQPSVIQAESQASVSELVVASVSALMPNLKPSIPYPSRRDNEKRRDQVSSYVSSY